MSLLERLSIEPVHKSMRGLLWGSRDGRRGDTMHITCTAASQASEHTVTNSAASAEMTKVIALAKTQGASIIGVTGTAHGVGVSTISQQLAQAYALFGKRVVLVDVSKVTRLPCDQARSVDGDDATLADYATRISSNVGLVDLLGLPCGTPNKNALRTMFRVAVDQELIIVVDLPPVVQRNDQPSQAFATVGTLCDIAFIVCPTGGVNANELGTCLETCSVVGVNLAGLVLNDWQLPASKLLSK